VKVFYDASKTWLYCRETWQIEEKRRRLFLVLTFKNSGEARVKTEEKERKKGKRNAEEKRR
jgi:hypothetical protein